MIDHNAVLRIEKIVHRMADPNEGTSEAATESLREILKRHAIHVSDLSVTVKGGPDAFVLLNDLKNVINRQQNEIQFLRLHADPLVLKNARKCEKIDYRWPEFEVLIRSRITGDDPETIELSSGWRTKTVNILGVSPGTIEKWKDGVLQIPERAIEQLRDMQPIAVSEIPVKTPKTRSKTKDGRIPFSVIRKEADEYGFVLMKKDEKPAASDDDSTEESDDSPKHKMDFFKHTEICALKYGDFQTQTISWSRVRRQIAYELLRSGRTVEELKEYVFKNGCWHFDDATVRNYLKPSKEDIEFRVKWTTRSCDEYSGQLEEIAKNTGQDIYIHVKWKPERGRARGANGDHAGPAVFPNKEGIVWFTPEAGQMFKFVLLSSSEPESRARIIDSIFGSSSTNEQFWPSF